MKHLEIELLNNGHVFARNGQSKIRVARPVKFKLCDNCGGRIKRNAVQVQHQNKVLINVCPVCAVDEIERFKNEPRI